MCEVMCIAMFIVYLVTGRIESAALLASVGFAIAGGLYRIGRGIEKARATEQKEDASGESGSVATKNVPKER